MRFPRDIIAQQSHTIYARLTPKVTDRGQTARGPSVKQGPTAACDLGRPGGDAHQQPQGQTGGKNGQRGRKPAHEYGRKATSVDGCVSQGTTNPE